MRLMIGNWDMSIWNLLQVQTSSERILILIHNNNPAFLLCKQQHRHKYRDEIGQKDDESLFDASAAFFSTLPSTMKYGLHTKCQVSDTAPAGPLYLSQHSDMQSSSSTTPQKSREIMTLLQYIRQGEREQDN